MAALKDTKTVIVLNLLWFLIKEYNIDQICTKYKDYETSFQDSIV